MNADRGWPDERQLDSPWFEPLRPLLRGRPPTRMPDVDELNRLLRQHRPWLRTAAGAPLRFVSVDGRTPDYEKRIFVSGQVPVRRNAAHDVYNALAWLCYPGFKTALNREHVRAHDGDGRRRGPRRDTLTLLDENGAVLVCARRDLLALLADFRWQQLFVERRAEVCREFSCSLLGHGLWVKALKPYVGLTAHALVLAPPPGYERAGPGERIALLDRALAARLARPGRLCSPRELQPLPLLGLPGWWPANAEPHFYSDRSYFRPGRRRRALGN